MNDSDISVSNIKKSLMKPFEAIYRYYFRLLAIAMVLVLSGCKTFQSTGTSTESFWMFSAAQSISIYDTQTGTALEIEEFTSLLSKPNYILLGETHDNPIHHDIELAVIKQLIASGWLKQVSMEMLTPKQTHNYYASGSEESLPQPLALAAIKNRLLWPDRGWPWNDYAAVIEATLTSHIQLAAANIERDDIMRIYQGGGDDKVAPSTTRFSPSPAQTTALATTIEESHCGHIDASMVPPMIAIQLAKDQAMAQSLEQAASGALLIAGAFHVRKDLSVPQHFSPQNAEKQTLVIAMLEASAQKDDSQAKLSSAEVAQSLHSQYDIVIFTPEHPREDPCNVFNKKQE